MDLPTNLCKSTILATVIFWSVILTEHFEASMFSIIFISMIPIFMSCALTITITICPFFWSFQNSGFDKPAIFKSYFPYYAIVCFSLSVCCIFINDFEIYAVAFFTSVFITTSYSWVWFSTSKAS